MKKIVLLFSLAMFVFQSCKKDEIGGTATEKVAGEWSVTADALKADGSLVEKDVYGLGHFLIGTYNTVENSGNLMWIDDYTNFWKFKGQVNVDLNSSTFSGANIQNASTSGDDIKFTITNGKILKGAAKTPSGMPADSIVFEVKFSDDDPVANGFDRYRITGYRYTGLVNDEDH